MELQGTIEHITEIEENGTFKKRSLILGTEKESQYPQSVNIEFQQGNVDLLNNKNVGDNVTVSINIKGRKWTNPEGIDKWFNNIVGWKVS